MSTLVEVLGGKRILAPHAVIGRTFKEDLDAWRRGILDTKGFREGYTKQRNPVVLEVRHPDGSLKQLLYGGNQRTNVGGSWQMSAMGGDVAAGTSATGQATASSPTTLTTTTTTSTTTQYVGHVLYVTTSATNMVFGRIKSHTNGANAVFTVDQWYLAGSATGAAGTQASATGTYIISDSQGPGYWLALSTDTATNPTGTDTTLTGEVSITTYFSAQFARVKGVYTPTAPTGSAANTTNAGIYTLSTGVMTCTTGVTLGHAAIFDALSVGQMLFSKLFTTAATLAVADTLNATWTLTNS